MPGKVQGYLVQKMSVQGMEKVIDSLMELAPKGDPVATKARVAPFFNKHNRCNGTILNMVHTSDAAITCMTLVTTLSGRAVSRHAQSGALDNGGRMVTRGLLVGRQSIVKK
jgi:hypothetical protein